MIKKAFPVSDKFYRYIFLAIAVTVLLILLNYCRKQWRENSASERESSIHHMIVEKTEQMGKLEVVKYRIKDVVEQKIERSWLNGGDTKVLVIVSGEAVGCIDLKLLKEEDITFSDDKIYIQLPAPQICYAKVNHNDSKVYDAPTSPFSNNANAVDLAFKNAENQIQQAALEMGILDESKENARKVLMPLFSTISGGKEVVITYKGEPKNGLELKKN
ncbi:MAG: DUF4230 domain-containing protein [Sphingobacteriales bacterium]|nr:MAG: DUF4230 domain-containing protein [Sphingobacteriales bacterium]